MAYHERRSSVAKWSWRISALSFAVFTAGLVTHRFFPAHLPTPTALKLFEGAVVGALIGISLAVFGLRGIWIHGYLGAGRAAFALFLSILVLALPISALPKIRAYPWLFEVTTDIASPPAFDRVARIRQAQTIRGAANPSQYQRSFAGMQQQRYGDLAPLLVPRPLTEVYSSVRETVKALGWRVLDEQVPEGTTAGRIEAEDKTLIFGFVDDVVIRVSGSPKEAKVDVRSSSRYGPHDLGRNANRIRRLLTDVKARINQLDRAENMERVIARRAQETKPSVRQGLLAARENRSLVLPRSAALTASLPLPPAANVPQSQTPARGSTVPASSSSQSPVQPAIRAEQKPSKRQRQRERTESQRRFWELNGR